MTAFDTIIVGAGSAGCVLAARLTEQTDHRVLLLEAGPDHRDADLPEELRYLSRPVKWPYDWGDAVVSVDDRRLFYGRGRGVGGSSATNGGVALRAEPEDFATWPAEWQWPALLPSYCRSEHDLDFGTLDYHGDAGPIPVVRWPRAEWVPLQVAFHDACRSLGFAECDDHNAPGTTGVGPIPMNRVERMRISNALAYLEPARERATLTVRGDTHVRRIVVAGARATGVELDDGECIDAGQVILAAGVIQDPLLLWRSGVGPADRVRALGIEPVLDRPAVGAHMTDHFVMSFAADVPPELAPDDAPTLQNILRATTDGSDRVHDLQLTPWVRRHPDGGRALGMSVSCQLPDGEGSATPTSADPHTPARIAWPFTQLPTNVARLREGWRLAARICAATGLVIDDSPVRAALSASDEALDTLIADEHTAFYHGVGTCAMGDWDDDDSVVDPELRVRGIEALRIVDASVIPAVPRSNTNLVVTALAERAVELLVR